MVEYHIIVEGLVQGVCFRATTLERAKKYGIFGSVCNLNNGTVKIVAQGEENQIQDFLESLKKDSGMGKVDKMTLSKEEITSPLHSFEITY